MYYSLVEGILKLSMPLVTAQVNGLNLTFLIDTGSTHNIIQYQDVITVNATLKIEGVELKSAFNVVDMSDAVMKLQDETGLQLHGFLGIPFLMDNKCVLDFHNQQLVISEVQ